MPKRSLKEEITTSERLAAVSFNAECLFYRLLVCADDFGRFDARPIIVRSRAMPLRDVCLTDVGQWLQELHGHDLIQIYTVHDKPYLKIQRWTERLRANASKFPNESGAYEKNVSQPSDDCPTDDGRLTAEERGARSEVRGARSGKATRGTRLSPDWQPSADELAWAKSERPDLIVSAEVENFRDYWLAKSGKDATKLDWTRTWKSWIRNAYAKKGGKIVPAGRPWDGAS